MEEPDLKTAALTRWRESLLAEADVSLGALAGQYLARPGRGWDRDALVSGLSAFLSTPETQSSVPALMDSIDVLIVGSLLASGGLPPEDLGRLLAAELAYHEVEYRLANLQERLIVFRARTGEYEVTPQLAPSLAKAAGAERIFGSTGAADRGPKPLIAGRPLLSIQELCFVAWALLHEGPDPLLKTGGLSVRARKRILEITGGDDGGAGSVAAILEAFTGLGLATAGESGRAADQKSLARFLGLAGDELPYILAAAMAGIPVSAGKALKGSFDPFVERRFIFSGPGLDRFASLSLLGTAPGGAKRGDEASAFKAALVALGIVSPEEDDGQGSFACVPERVQARWTAPAAASGGPAVAVDGSGGIQVLPPASPGDLAFLANTANLVSASGGWRFRLGRDAARRAFSDGWTVKEIAGELERLSRHPLPQTLVWDLEAWRSEYDSVRIFRGQTLVLDGPAADLVEKSGAFARIPHETIGSGLYFFGATHAKAIEEALTAVGLPPPSLRGGLSANRPGGAASSGEGGRGAAPKVIEPAMAADVGSRARNPESERDIGLSFGAQPLSENPDPALRAELERLLPNPAERRAYEEMLDRKLVYTRDQLRGMVERDRAERRSPPGRGRTLSPSAVGLDFNGKLRVIQAAFKTKFSRLDARWVSGTMSLQALVRPVSLRRTEKDYELEGENLSTGRPVTIRVGSLTYIGLKKGYYLGDT